MSHANVAVDMAAYYFEDTHVRGTSGMRVLLKSTVVIIVNFQQKRVLQP